MPLLVVSAGLGELLTSILQSSGAQLPRKAKVLANSLDEAAATQSEKFEKNGENSHSFFFPDDVDIFFGGGQKGKIFIYIINCNYDHVCFLHFFRDEHCIYQLFWDEHSGLEWFKGTRLLHGFYDPN